MAFLMKRRVFATSLLALILAFGILALFWGERAQESPALHKNSSYEVDGRTIKLVDGSAEESPEGGASGKLTTTYFGNEAKGDFDANGQEDIAFLFTQQSGGSGTFFYVVAALAVEGGYHGTNGVLIGDRVAPQSTEFKNGEIVVNYKEHAPGEALSSPPTVSMSKYFKVESGRLIEIVRLPALERGSGISGVVMLGPNCPVVADPPEAECADRPYLTELAVTSPDGAKVIKQFSSHADGKFAVDLPPGGYAIRSAAAANVLPYCSGPGLINVAEGAFTNILVSCDTGIR